MADASVLETSLRRRVAAELARRAAGAGDAAEAAASRQSGGASGRSSAIRSAAVIHAALGDSSAGQSSPAAAGRAAAERTSSDANGAGDTLPASTGAEHTRGKPNFIYVWHNSFSLLQVTVVISKFLARILQIDYCVIESS